MSETIKARVSMDELTRKRLAKSRKQFVRAMVKVTDDNLPADTPHRQRSLAQSVLMNGFLQILAEVTTNVGPVRTDDIESVFDSVAEAVESDWIIREGKPS